MSLDTANCAVARFLSHKPKEATIGFYGGEPLLEFERMKEIVAFAEQLAADNGVELRFNVTTNGTLLSEEKIHYLVAHKFAVMISLDGNKESHDRYRVFKNTGHPEQAEAHSTSSSETWNGSLNFIRTIPAEESHSPGLQLEIFLSLNSS